MKIRLIKNRNTVLLIFLGLVFLGSCLYVYVYKPYKEKVDEQKIEDATIPKTVNGPWKKYIWDNKRFIYPPEWTLTERKIYQEEKNIPIEYKGNNIAGFILSPNGIVGDDSIYVGGGKEMCVIKKATICIGNEPVYTSSRNAEVLNVFNKIVKSIKHLDGTPS